jgi:hypothetical protein
VSFLSEYFQQEFNHLPSEWEKTLVRELKLTELGNKNIKKTIDLGQWPTLSLSAGTTTALPVQEQWKKAAQTYGQNFSSQQIAEDLKDGVRVFFFYKKFLNPQKWREIITVLEGYKDPQELEVVLLGHESTVFSGSTVNVKNENHLNTGRAAHDEGGNNIQELALCALQLVESLENSTNADFGIFVDSQFFKNIAKIRALKLLAHKVFEEAQMNARPRVYALTSMRDWTLFERYSNMLRNDASVAAAYIGGADIVQSSGYQLIFDLVQKQSRESEHDERSLRMARNTSHILALESMLGIVQDAAYGSFHLEELTQHYAAEAWSLMQRLLPLNQDDRKKLLKEEISQVQEQRLVALQTRRHVLTGVNDFPDRKEKLELNEFSTPFFRVAAQFEELRLRMDRSPKRPKVFIALFGDYANLNARVNFVKNYFELIGLEVTDPGKGHQELKTLTEEIKTRSEEIIVLCASDDQYPALEGSLEGIKATEKYLAGKYQLKDFSSLYAGQNVFEVLNSLVNRWEQA